ncbi:MAG TPA: reductive dehalogenase [Anaerolineales bacterium]|jgi:reductive dehalogenase
MSTTKDLTRRDFVKSLGLAGMTLPAVTVIGRIGSDELVTSEAFGGFLIRRHAAADPPYQVDDSIYRRFNQHNEVFSRAVWDKEIVDAEAPYAKVPLDHIMANDPGFNRMDYAFYTASWTVATVQGNGAGAVGGSNGGLYSWQPLPGSFLSRARLTEMGPWDMAGYTPREVTDIVKKAALFYGASMAGIAELDERWIYSHRDTKGYSDPPNIVAPILFEDVDVPEERADKTLVIPRSMKYVISMAFEMDYDGYQYPIGGPANAATGNGYSKTAFTAASLAEFIRGMGYHAIPSGNCTGLSIPIAVDAGLGELGRNGMLITPKYGPRVRLGKVITDMPLTPDSPISFGATEFCEICGKCADTCPAGGIIKGQNQRTYDARNISNNPGVYKWPVDVVACHMVWSTSGMSCHNCIRVCPFNKPEGWLHDATRSLIGMRSGAADQAILALDDASQYATEEDSREYWKKDNFIHIKNA